MDCAVSHEASPADANACQHEPSGKQPAAAKNATVGEKASCIRLEKIGSEAEDGRQFGMRANTRAQDAHPRREIERRKYRQEQRASRPQQAVNKPMAQVIPTIKR